MVRTSTGQEMPCMTRTPDVTVHVALSAAVHVRSPLPSVSSRTTLDDETTKCGTKFVADYKFEAHLDSSPFQTV